MILSSIKSTVRESDSASLWKKLNVKYSKEQSFLAELFFDIIFNKFFAYYLTVFNFNFWFSVNADDCKELSFSSLTVEFDSIYVLRRIAVISPLTVYHVFIEISDDQRIRSQLRSSNGSPLVIFSCRKNF